MKLEFIAHICAKISKIYPDSPERFLNTLIGYMCYFIRFDRLSIYEMFKCLAAMLAGKEVLSRLNGRAIDIES